MPNPCPFCGAAVDRAKYVSMVSGGKTRTRHAESQLAKVRNIYSLGRQVSDLVGLS